MMSSKLSKPLKFSGKCFKDDMEETYTSIKDIFIDKDKRPKYNNKFIFFDMNNKIKINKNKEEMIKVLDKPERFYHIVSIEPKLYYNINPCGNDDAIVYCKNECKYKNALEEFLLLNRVECYYRMSRLRWISEVIALANLKDPLIQEWTEVEYYKKLKKRDKIYKRYIRYAHKRDDYVVILREERCKGEIKKYRFITAFPLFIKDNKSEYTDKYNKYKNQN